MAFDRMQSYGPSKLGITSVAGQRAMDAQARSVQNEVQEQKRTERLGRRAYRAAARGKDPSNYLRGLQALEDMRAVNGSSGAGIKMAGVRQQGIEQGLASTRAQIDNFNGKTVDEQGRIAPKPQSRLMGSTPDNSVASSSGGEWVDVGGRIKEGASRLTPIAEPPTFPKPTLLSALPPGQALDAQSPDTRFNSLVDKYADQFPGLSKLKGLSSANKSSSLRDGENARVAQEIAFPNSTLTPENKRQLRRAVAFTGGNPQEEAQVRGEMAVGGLVNRLRDTNLGDVKSIISGGMDTIASRLLSGVASTKNQLGETLDVMTRAPLEAQFPGVPYTANGSAPPSAATLLSAPNTLAGRLQNAPSSGFAGFTEDASSAGSKLLAGLKSLPGKLGEMNASQIKARANQKAGVQDTTSAAQLRLAEAFSKPGASRTSLGIAKRMQGSAQKSKEEAARTRANTSRILFR